MKGFVSLHRKILGWEWYDEPNTLRVFLHLLLKARHKNGSWRGCNIKRGQVIIGRKSLANDLNLSEQNVRTALKNLQLTNEITTEPTNEFTLVTITAFNSYQNTDNQVTNQVTNQPTNNQPANQPTINQQSTSQLTNDQPQRDNVNKYNNVNNVNKCDDVKEIVNTKFDNNYILNLSEHLKISPDKIKKLKTDFLRLQKLKGKNWENSADFRSHFISWAAIQLKKAPKNKNKGGLMVDKYAHLITEEDKKELSLKQP